MQVKPSHKLFALVDCNSFYASCEKIFRPDLKNRPVAVLSNNDGVVVACSREVKELGIPTGQPYYKCAHILDKHDVKVFSSNYILYGDISNRVMSILKEFSKEIEIYSIDEAFLRLENLNLKDPTQYAMEVRKTVEKWTGVPISAGIGPTKTLAKAANKLAKKYLDLRGVLDLTNHPQKDKFLDKLQVKDIWGIGRQYSKFLIKNGIKTALQLKNTADNWAKKKLTVSGLRTVLELRGISCIELDHTPSPRKGIISSRSFSHPVTKLSELKESVAKYIAIAAEKLRADASTASKLTVYITTNWFKDEPQYSNQATITLPEASSYTPELVTYAHQALESIYKDQYSYKKAMVILSDIRDTRAQQKNIFSNYTISESQDNDNLMNSVDYLKKRWGRDSIKLAAEGIEQKWWMKSEMRSARLTTCWEELPRVKV